MIPIINLPAAILTVLFNRFFDSFHSPLRLMQTAATSTTISSEGVVILGGVFCYLVNKLRNGTLVSTTGLGSRRMTHNGRLRKKSWCLRNIFTGNRNCQANALNKLYENMNYLPGTGDSPRTTLKTPESSRRIRRVPSKYIEDVLDEDNNLSKTSFISDVFETPRDSSTVPESVSDLTSDNPTYNETITDSDSLINSDVNQACAKRKPIRRGEGRMNKSVIGKHLKKFINRQTRSGKIYGIV